MDSRNPLNPYSQSSESRSLVGLLNSQNFRYESYQDSDSVNFGASEIPPYSSQQTATPLASRERKKWTPADDEVIISAWLNTSKDPIVGNSQKSGTFWARVGDYYASSPHGRAQGAGRGELNIKQRWHKINDFTNKFCAAHAAAERQISSGQSDLDVLKLAHDIYYTNNNKKFTLEHAWCMLRYEQKWCSLNTPKPSGSSKRKASETPSESTNTTAAAADHDVRPEGLISMGLHSYSQPSLSDDYGYTCDNSDEEELSSRDQEELIYEELIRRDQSELSRREQEEFILQYGEMPRYPKWATFIQSIKLPQGEKNSLFAKKQEAVRKDVERAFGVLQSRFAVVKNPSKLWDKEKMGNIMRACIILHNMIVEDERSTYTNYDENEFQERGDEDTFTVKRAPKLSSGNTMDRRRSIVDRQIHRQLKYDLIENIWDKFGHLQE